MASLAEKWLMSKHSGGGATMWSLGPLLRRAVRECSVSGLGGGGSAPARIRFQSLASHNLGKCVTHL